MCASLRQIRTDLSVKDIVKFRQSKAPELLDLFTQLLQTKISLCKDDAQYAKAYLKSFELLLVLTRHGLTKDVNGVVVFLCLSCLAVGVTGAFTYSLQ